jgi:hypothetical protein
LAPVKLGLKVKQNFLFKTNRKTFFLLCQHFLVAKKGKKIQDKPHPVIAFTPWFYRVSGRIGSPLTINPLLPEAESPGHAVL